jgi:stress-induced morphogen
MPIDEKTLREALEKDFPDATIKIEDMVGDQDHYFLEIASHLFSGKSLVQQHKMVNEALGFCLGNQLHALKIKTIAIMETI